MKRILNILLATFTFLISCEKKVEEKFKKTTSSHSKITFKNTLVDSPELNILTYLYYYNGAGVAAADFNNDGKIDLYFTSNQGADKLYLNKGELRFEDITNSSKINNTGNWTTGVTHVDINNDGLLDIYVCKVGEYKNIKGHNLLFVNQGIDEKGIPHFKEEAAKYGLDFSGFSTQAAFFDYDLDGDLDMYLLNHSVYPNRTYGKGSQRKQIDTLSGDQLYKNENGKFINSSIEAGIFQGKIGYGLGLAISDINNDGYPDIYIGNDFFENDYLYVNQKNGTFKEIISTDAEKLGHTTHFSMGNDIADINNDGLTDIVSMDMLPEDLHTYKTSGLEYAYPIYSYYIKNGYSHQYMQNTLHMNLGNENFSEIGNLSGISATEWSWGSLFADFDNDGYKDLFISNGIKGATNDMDFINFISNNLIQKKIEDGMSEDDMRLIDKLPSKKAANYFFKNNRDLTFSDVTEIWYKKEDSYSNGVTYADLDNDGDLDIVVNNVNEEAYVLENKTATINRHLKIKFKNDEHNIFGIGAKVIAHHKGLKIVNENYSTRGYLSAVPNEILIGTGKDSIIDSLEVVWPNGKYQTLRSLKTNKNLILDSKNATKNYYELTNNPKSSYSFKTETLNVFLHKEKTSIAFSRDPLIPFANTNEGPSISVTDINKDSLEDFLISGAKGQPSQLFLQNIDGSFSDTQKELFTEDALQEDISHIFIDVDNDLDEDLIIVSGGNEFKKGIRLQPRLYINTNGHFKKDSIQFKDVTLNASKVSAVDFDNDNDLDLLITSDQEPWQFGVTPKQYLFRNNGKGDFENISQIISKDFQSIGNVKDATWSDINDDGFKDLILVGHWMSISIFINNGKSLELQNNNGLSKTNGLWNSILAHDFDNDGDIDFIAGNWGSNSKFKASEENPLKLYRSDFDDNGSIETLVTYYHKGTETPFASKDELVKQIPFLNKNFLSYKDFAKTAITELFSREKLKSALKKEVYELKTLFFENDGQGNFKPKALPIITQASNVHDMIAEDFNDDGFKDVLIVGNSYEVSTQLGRMDALHGLILQNDTKGKFHWNQDSKINIPGAARNIKKIKIKEKDCFIITINNNSPIILYKE